MARPTTRPPIQRILILDREIRSGRFPNSRRFIELLEVDRRTILRDLEFMRDRLHAPIEFDRRRQGYRYTREDYQIPALSLTESELLALFIAESAVGQYRGTPFGPDLERAFDKIRSSLDDRARDVGRELSDRFSFHLASRLTVDEAIFHQLARAVESRSSLRIRYRALSADRATERVVDPYHLACVSATWYLIAYCRLREAVRQFVPSRIESLEPTGETFRVPSDFSIDEYLGRAFGVFRADVTEPIAVRIRFRGLGARIVLERHWHPSQTVEILGDDDLILGLHVADLREAERLVLAWLPHAEALTPPALRAQVAAAAREGARMHLGEESRGVS